MRERRRLGRSWAASVMALTLPALMLPAQAAELDVESQLSVPGAKLLVVEFFATWCGPCMAAVPRWEALRRKYAKRGLRFVVVSVKDDVEQCQDVPWRPDVIVCDEEGSGPGTSRRLGTRSSRRARWTERLRRS